MGKSMPLFNSSMDVFFGIAKLVLDDCGLCTPGSFDFNEVSEDHILKLLKSLDGTKSTGYDKIPASFIKTAVEELSLPTMNLVNQTTRNTKFPTVMKLS